MTKNIFFFFQYVPMTFLRFLARPRGPSCAAAYLILLFRLSQIKISLLFDPGIYVYVCVYNLFRVPGLL